MLAPHDGGSHGVGEEVRTRTLAEHIDDLLRAGRETAHRTAERLAERTGEDVNLAVAVELFCHAVSCRAHHACGVAFVHHHKSVILLGKLTNLVHRSHVAVHREHAVSGDDAETAILGFLQATLEVGQCRHWHSGNALPCRDARRR